MAKGPLLLPAESDRSSNPTSSLLSPYYWDSGSSETRFYISLPCSREPKFHKRWRQAPGMCGAPGDGGEALRVKQVWETPHRALLFNANMGYVPAIESFKYFGNREGKKLILPGKGTCCSTLTKTLVLIHIEIIAKRIFSHLYILFIPITMK